MMFGPLGTSGDLTVMFKRVLYCVLPRRRAVQEEDGGLDMTESTNSLSNLLVAKSAPPSESVLSPTITETHASSFDKENTLLE